MKYLAFGILFTVVCATASAQKTAGTATYPAVVTGMVSDKAIPDTLFHNFFNLSPVLYTAPVGGWMNGTNGYGDKEKAQEIKFTQTYILTGLIYWFAVRDKNTGGDTSSVIYRLYRKDSVQQVNGAARLVPGTVLASDTVKLADINAGVTYAAGLNLFSLPQPLVMHQNYVGSFSMELMHPNDEIALFGTTDGQVEITDYSWEKWNGKWNTIKNAWTLDIDFAVFPVLDLTGASINESEMAEVRISPNPASDFININTTAQFKEYVILNAAGQIVKQGNTNADNFQVSLQDFSSGYYVIGLYSGNGENAKFFRFVKN